MKVNDRVGSIFAAKRRGVPRVAAGEILEVGEKFKRHMHRQKQSEKRFSEKEEMLMGIYLFSGRPDNR